MSRVLVVATSRKTHGGINAVIKAHEKGEQWKQYHCIWIQSHRDGSFIIKIYYFLIASIQFIFLLPFTDLVHIHHSLPISSRRKYFFFKLAKIFGKKTIVHFHASSADNTIFGDYRELYRKLFVNADRVVVISEYWKKLLSEVYPNAKVQIIYNPCVLDVPNIDLTTAIKCFTSHTILFAGSIIERKGYADLIRAFEKIAHIHLDWKIVFAGNGDIDKGKHIAEHLGISSQIEWLGWVTGDEKDKAFRNADIFCLPSYEECFPMAVLDAWAYGLPVITTPVGGIVDVAEDCENILLFSPGDIDALADCLERMITDVKIRNRIAKESSNLVLKNFNVDTINKQIGVLYKELLG